MIDHYHDALCVCGRTRAEHDAAVVECWQFTDAALLEDEGLDEIPESYDSMITENIM